MSLCHRLPRQKGDDQFYGQVIGLRRSDSGVFFLHGDHLGSVSAVTNASDALTAVQHDDPWGRMRTGGVGQTALNFTGQRLDATGHAVESADIAFIAYELYDISQNRLTWENGLALLAADVGGLVLPGLTGGGALVRRGGRGARDRKSR